MEVNTESTKSEWEEVGVTDAQAFEDSNNTSIKAEQTDLR